MQQQQQQEDQRWRLMDAAITCAWHQADGVWCMLQVHLNDLNLMTAVPLHCLSVLTCIFVI
jgi:hypothetical protein